MTTMAPTGKDSWQTEFYKNGYPKEVIVIEDSPTPPRTPQQESQYSSTCTLKHTPLMNDTILPPAASTRSKRAIREQEEQQNTQVRWQKRRQQQQQQPLPSTPTFTPTTTKKRRKLSGPTTQGPTRNTNVSARLAPNRAPPSSPIDDKDGHFIFKPNESLTQRYKMMRLLGQGTFGKVIECYDRVKQCHCAIKVIRAIQKYRDASKIEIRVLNVLREHDPLNLNNCIHLVEWFDYENHICMVFELLGQSVFDFLKANHFQPFPLCQIQQIAKQLFTSIAFVHQLKLIHTDLKPENILLISNDAVSKNKQSDKPVLTLKSTKIRLIDFGSATFDKEYHSSVVSTRHYRAPEIILGIGWSFPCDIWSIGCILVELFTGDALFQTHDNLEHLAMMEAVLGKIPLTLARQSTRNGQKFYKDNRLQYPTTETTRQSKKYVKALKPLQDIVPSSQSKGNAYLFDLLKKIFVYDPALRITAREALHHPFFQCDV
ncbi:kinase-like domain-containing protein [Halteromyces radiatus]|uniref:kinase-like domain-containing protein n=1 Tax=Halteromyces radiatus TaxID=101107 RepID=UPI00221FEB15|nr:kinase-like domain-containing protein [Halteromyces radiatus]KAI8077745.1 kinase-like domain-containing protein [Halteromyces radiatus]